jgi:YHS domain-containing protein
MARGELVPSVGSTPMKDNGKGVAPKDGKPKSKAVKGKTYYWCNHHANPLWALHNPNAFPNLCWLISKHVKLEAAHKGGGKVNKPTVADIWHSRAHWWLLITPTVEE